MMPDDVVGSSEMNRSPFRKWKECVSANQPDFSVGFSESDPTLSLYVSTMLV